MQAHAERAQQPLTYQEAHEIDHGSATEFESMRGYSSEDDTVADTREGRRIGL